MPVDEYGRRRMPAAQYRGDPGELLDARARGGGLVAALTAGTVGLRNPGIGTWVMQMRVGRPLSEGTLWVKIDNNNVILDVSFVLACFGSCWKSHLQCVVQRVFRKDVHLSERSWDDPREWEGDVRDPASKIPNELACHNSLLQVTRRNVVDFRESMHRGLIDNDACRYRLYIEWCQHQNLQDLIDSHRDHPSIVPEPMIWYVAEVLAKCGLAMEKGFAWIDGLADDEWKQIVHR